MSHHRRQRLSLLLASVIPSVRLPARPACPLWLHAPKQWRPLLQHMDGGERRAVFHTGPALFFDFRTWPLLNHPLVMFACLPHVHTQWSKAPQPVWCLYVCTGSAGRASTLPQRQLWFSRIGFHQSKRRSPFWHPEISCRPQALFFF